MGDCDFALKQGSRTKADDTDSSGLFVGDWVYGVRTHQHTSVHVPGKRPYTPAPAHHHRRAS